VSHTETLYQKESELSAGFNVTGGDDGAVVLMWSCLFWEQKWQTGLEPYKLQVYFLRLGKSC